MIAAAGTGGHVYPGLSVAEALMASGVDRAEIVFVGGDRLESDVYPAMGFPFLQVELAGLQRSMTTANFRIPSVVMKARKRIIEEIESRGTRAVLGMGGYATIPAGLAARAKRIPLFNAEQNAEAGLANRVTARWARASFVAFPETVGIPGGEWVGNPVREQFWEFDRAALRPEGLARFRLEDEQPVVGVFGGSLGARALNEATAAMLVDWPGAPVQVVHICGRDHVETMQALPEGSNVTWRRLGFEERMDLFYAVCDLVVARAGGAVAELTATATPSILVPGSFGSSGHQLENARALDARGAARVLPEGQLADLRSTVESMLSDSGLRAEMSLAAEAMAKPDAARTIARAMTEAAA